MEETRFLYSVNPRRAIKNLSEVPIVRVSKSLQLTKSDVLKCLECGPVYRRFANEKRLERVTKYNLDRLHNSKYMTEEEYNMMSNTMADETVKDECPKSENEKEFRGKVIAVVEEEINEPVVANIPDSSVEEVEKVAVEEPVVDIANEVVEEVENAVEEPVAEENTSVEEPVTDATEVENVVEEEIVEEPAEVYEEVKVNDKNQNHGNYQGKKKHH